MRPSSGPTSAISPRRFSLTRSWHEWRSITGTRHKVGPSSSTRNWLVRRPTYALPWLAVAALLDLAHAYLAIADIGGARARSLKPIVSLDGARQLGTLIAEFDDIRGQLADAAETLVGSSALTPAELRLLPFLSTYLTFEEIAGRLSLSRHTIKSQAIAVYAKLQATSRSQAVERAIELGLIEPLPGLLLARGTPED